MLGMTWLQHARDDVVLAVQGGLLLVHSTLTVRCSPSCVSVDYAGLLVFSVSHAKNATAACFSLFLAQYSRSW